MEKEVCFRNSQGQLLKGKLRIPQGCSEAKTDNSAGPRPPCAIICHGMLVHKDWHIMPHIAQALGCCSYRFDFSGNGESEGEWDFSAYKQQVDDLRSVIRGLRDMGYDVQAIIGHSFGANVCLLYAAQFDDVAFVVNISGRYQMDGPTRFTRDQMSQLAKQGSFVWKTTMKTVVVTQAMIDARLKVDMSVIGNIRNASVLTVHGEQDDSIPVKDAHTISKIVPKHKLAVIPEAEHLFVFPEHEQVMLDLIKNFLRPLFANHTPPSGL